MTLYLIVGILNFIFLTLLGFVSHWMFHQRWSGVFFRKHITHHFRTYPKTDLISDIYRDSGEDNTFYLFALVFSPIVLTALLLTVFHIIPYGIGALILGQMLIVSIVNNSLHDSFHISKSFWHRFFFFKKLQHLHFKHHFFVKKNFGVFSFTWDKILGTYKE